MGTHFLLQEIFRTQGSNPGLLPCRKILYGLSHQESPSHAFSVTLILGSALHPAMEQALPCPDVGRGDENSGWRRPGMGEFDSEFSFSDTLRVRWDGMASLFELGTQWVQPISWMNERMHSTEILRGFLCWLYSKRDLLIFLEMQQNINHKLKYPYIYTDPWLTFWGALPDAFYASCTTNKCWLIFSYNYPLVAPHTECFTWLSYFHNIPGEWI